MEFAFNCEKLMGCDAEAFVIIDGKKGIQHVLNTNPGARVGGAKVVQEAQNQIYEVIDRIGAASSKAQGLPAIITSGSRLFTSDTRLYLRCEGNRTLALLKVGIRKLFIRNEMGSIKEISPLCVLDFYVHESVQRSGQGKQIFEKMLHSEDVKPEKLGYDRPSEKLLAFLAKHYGLKRYVPQNNNYVVYNQYFESGAIGGND